MFEEFVAEVAATVVAHITFASLAVLTVKRKNRMNFRGDMIRARDLFKRAFPAERKEQSEPADRRFQWRW